MKALLLAGGDIPSIHKIREYLDDERDIICIDSGLDYALKYGLEVSHALGDFDSVSDKTRARLDSFNFKITRFNEDKDKTDSHLALEYCLEKGYTDLIISGITGSRLDQTLNSLELMIYFYEDFNSILILDSHNEVYLCKDKLKIAKKPSYALSIIRATGAPIISLSGVRWPLKNHPIKIGQSITVSNQIIEDYARIDVTNGLVFVILSKT